jgi:transposase
MSFIRKIKRAGKTYLAEVESKRVAGRVIQKFIRYVGKEADGKTILSASISNAEIEHVKLYGPLMVLHHLATEINLPDHLGKYASEILSMVYAHCLDFRSVNQMSQWFQRTDLNMMLDIENLTEARLLKALDSLEENRLSQLQQAIFRSIQNKYALKGSGIIYDVTNTYLYGKKCPLGKLGHDKEGVKGRPLIQIGLGVTQEEGIPIFHKTFHGNIHDAKTLEDLVTDLSGHKIKSGLMVFDRGITSKNTLKELRKQGFDAIGGMALHEGLKQSLSELLRQTDFVQLEHRVCLNDNIFYAVTQTDVIDGVKGTLVWCFNSQQQKDLRESRYDEIVYAQKLIVQKQPLKPGMEKLFDAKGRLIQTALAAAEKFDGYTCIFSTRSLPKEKILKIYFGDKDIVEKAFQSLKGVVQLRPIRHWLYDRVVAHVFICYLAYLLLSLMKFHLKKLEISPMQALSELGTMYKVYLKDEKKDFSLAKVVTLTQTQKLILKAIDKKLLKL